MKGNLKGFLRLSKLGFLALFVSNVHAAGYRLEFQSPSVLADAGDAAVVEDAGTNWYNSAGLVDLPQQLVLGGTHIYQPTTFSGTATAPSLLIPGAPGFAASGKASTYNNVDLPAIHYSMPLNKCAAIGLSVVPAWGLLEDFGPNSMVRYDLIRIYSRTIDIAPSLAFRINRQWSIGGGPDMHYWYLSSKTAVRTQPATVLDSISRYSADDWAYGFHIGLLYKLTECTRFGINYRSKMLMNLKGYSDFAYYPSGPFFEGNDFVANIALPPTTSVSFYTDINPCWAIMGTITYDQWNVIRNLHGFNFVGPTGAKSTVVLPQHYGNTIDWGIGTHYRLNNRILLRGSIKYLQTPTINAYRDINFPDSQKLGLNIGARYQYTKCVAFDVMAAHVFTRAAPINITNLFGANINGHTSTSIDIAGAQIVWSI